MFKKLCYIFDNTYWKPNSLYTFEKTIVQLYLKDG